MTVSSTTTSVSFTGNGSTTSFAVTFPFQGTGTSSELTVVQRTIATGAETTLSYTTHYTVTGGSGSTGTVVAASAPADSVQWHIRRNTTTTQTVDYVTNDPFPADTHELALDRLAMAGQERDGDIAQAFKYPDTYTGSASTTVPEPSASKVLAWNSAASALENGPTTTAISAAATNAATATTKANEAAASAVTAANYAVKIDGVAAASDHSSKAWAVGGSGVTDTSGKGASKEWATETSGTVDGTSFSAKEYAAGTQASTGGSAKDWAQDTNQVNGAGTNDRSAKNWAQGASMTGSTLGGASKDWASLTSSTVDGTLFSSKEYALGVQGSNGGSSKQWALGGGSSYTEGTAVAGGVFSAKKYAANAAASAAVAASGQIYSTVVNQTGATISPALSADGTYFLCDTSSNNITVTLPAIGTSEGVKYAFQKTSASNSLIFARSGSDTLNGSASNITMTDVNAQIQFVSDDNSPDNWVGVNLSQITVGSGLSKTGSVVSLNLTQDQSWTGSQRSTPVTNTSGSFDMNTGNNFNYTPGGNQAITFTNITAGQGGILYVVNSGHTITKHASVKVDANLLSTVTAAGTYMLGYYAPTSAIIVVTNSLAVT